MTALEIITLLLPILAMLGSAAAFILSWRSRANNTESSTYTNLVSSINQMNITVSDLSKQLEEERSKRKELETVFELAKIEWNSERKILAQKLVHSDRTIVHLETRVAQLEKEKLELSALLSEQNKLLREENKLLKNGNSSTSATASDPPVE